VSEAEKQQPDADVANFTRLLHEVNTGDTEASDKLLPLVYEQLRAMADRKMRGESADNTLQATALVHEAYLRLVDVDQAQRWDGRGHFFAAAAEAMRRILVERARRRNRIRHGGGRKRLDLDQLQTHLQDNDDKYSAEELLALNDALDELAAQDPDAAQAVKLRYFAGLTTEQSAAAMDVSVRTAHRQWVYAKAWLYEYLSDHLG
jgi:RNA polymerase sigma factor (TIGR02999 family)